MPSTSPSKTAPTILIIGASRGLGHAIAAEFLRKPVDSDMLRDCLGGYCRS